MTVFGDVVRETHGPDPSTGFDPGVYRDRRYRAHLIATGRLIPLDARPTLRLDARARFVAGRHIAAGDHGRTILAAPPGYFALPLWHARALDARERREAARDRAMLAVSRVMAHEHAATLRALATL